MSPRVYVASTGAGAGAQADIWSVPGCSRFFAGACFPYGHDQLADFLGHTPQQSCSKETAIEMATMAYYRATDQGCPAIGVGLSAAVASDRQRKGENRIHGAVMTDDGVWAVSIMLGHEFGPEARKAHGELADELIADLVTGTTRVSAGDTALATALFLANGYWDRSGSRSPLPPPDRSMFPGAFNPPHEGHLELAAMTDAVFWVESQAPNKPELRLSDLVKRAKLLRGHDRFFTSGYPLYTDKSNAFPWRTFVVGADAVLRMFDPKWGPSPVEVGDVLAKNNTTLAVARRNVAGTVTWGTTLIPRNVNATLLDNRHTGLSSSAIRASAEQNPKGTIDS